MIDTTITITIEHAGCKWSVSIPEDGYADCGQLDAVIGQVVAMLAALWSPDTVNNALVEYADIIKTPVAP